jgi:hypothetical protein
LSARLEDQPVDIMLSELALKTFFAADERTAEY